MIDPRLQPVADAIRAGDTVEAIRLLREVTGMSQIEAAEAVERLRNEADASARAASGSAVVAAGEEAASHAGTTDFASEIARDVAALRAPRDVYTQPLQGPLADEVAALALANKYLDAIKLVRARTGADLKTAKNQVEMVMEDRGIAKPGNTGCMMALMGFIFLVGVIVYVLAMK